MVPEIEAIHTPTLVELEKEGLHVIPTARAAWLTMNREGIRRLAAEELGLPTSPYRFCDSEAEYRDAIAAIGYPFVIKPVMSSSGKGQSIVRDASAAQHAWEYAQSGGRAGKGRVIVEGFVRFDYEITLLTVRHKNGTSFCAPIGHRQEDGDYRESWQPQPMSPAALAEAQRQAEAITAALGGWGVFGVEFFVKGDGDDFFRGEPASARYRPGDADLAGALRIRPACACDSGLADSRDSPERPIRLVRCAGGRRGAWRRAITVLPRRWRSRIPSCASSASRK